METDLNGGFIEESIDSYHILADDSICHVGRTDSVGQFDSFSGDDSGYFLIEALGIQIKHTSISCIKFGISYFSLFFAPIASVTQPASSFDHIELLLGVKTVEKEIFVLIDADVDIIAGFPAFPRISAGVVDHDTHQFHPRFRRRHLVVFQDEVGQVRNVNPCIAFSCEIQFVFLEVGKLLIELQQSFKVIFCSCGVIGLRSAFRLTKSYSSWRCDEEEISFEVPRVGVDFEGGGTFFEDKGSCFIDHSDETRAPGSSVEPEDEGVVVGISLTIEEDVVKLAGIKIKIA